MADHDNRTVITDIDIPFIRLVAFMIKVALASIPAAIIVSLILGLISMVLGGLFGGFGPFMHGPRV